MALPLIPILGAAGVAAYLLLSGKSTPGAVTAPTGPGVAPSYGGPAAPAPGASGGGQTYGTSPGQIDPNTGMTILGPGGTNEGGGLLGNAVGSDGSDDGSGGTAMNAAVATGTEVSGVVGAPQLQYHQLADGSWTYWNAQLRCWVPTHDGHEYGAPPPPGLPVF